MADPLKDLTYRVGKLELKPDDVVVVKLASHDPALTESALGLAGQLAKIVNHSVVVLHPDVDLSVLTAEEIAARTIKPT